MTLSHGPLRCAFVLAFLLITATSGLAEPQVTVNPKLGPLKTDGSADDPAIWIHPQNPAKSLVFGSDKDEGIYVFDFTGRKIQQVDLSMLKADRLNNIDVRNGFRLGPDTIDILAGNLRDDGRLAVLRINPDWSATSPPLTVLAHGKSSGNAIQDDSYGFTLYKDPADGKIYAFERPAGGGKARQYLIDGTSGSIVVTKVRDLQYGGGTAEGFVADDELGFVYITEEAKGIHKYHAGPDKPATRVAFFASGDGTASDREGLALYACNNKTGYLVLSSQGNSKFKVYAREGNNAFLKTFTASRSRGTDGLDVASAIAPGFPNGFAVIHNDPGSDFYVYDWADIAQTHLVVCPNGSVGTPTCAPACGPWTNLSGSCGTRNCTRADCANATETKDCAQPCPPACGPWTNSSGDCGARNCTRADCTNASETKDCQAPCSTDADNDGYKAEAACGSVRDCDDTDADISPGRPERCGNGLDDDCDTQTDEGCGCFNPPPCDSDCDGVVGAQCGGPDCHDGNAAIRPNRTERCRDGFDNNCNGLIDAQDPSCLPGCATDRDRDGYPAGANCPGAQKDCDDRNDRRHPNASELCGNGVDEDCDGQDAPCGRAFVCEGDVPIGECDTNGNFCFPNRTLNFNCYVCPCARGARCVNNVCVSRTCLTPCPAGTQCRDGACAPTQSCTPEWFCGPMEPPGCPSEGIQRRTCTQTSCPSLEQTKVKAELCTPATLCDNGILDPGEDCDGGATPPTCAAVAAGLEGPLACDAFCRYDTRECCATATALAGAFNPKYPLCEDERATGGPGSTDGSLDPDAPDAEGDDRSAALESPKAWYRSPANLILIAVSLALLGLLLKQLSLYRAEGP